MVITTSLLLVRSVISYSGHIMEISRRKVGIISTKLFVILLALIIIGNIIAFIGIAKYMDYIDAKYKYNEEVQEPTDALVLLYAGVAIAVIAGFYIFFVSLSHSIKRYLNNKRQE